MSHAILYANVQLHFVRVYQVAFVNGLGRFKRLEYLSRIRVLSIENQN
jgi:hypothetical protein